MENSHDEHACDLSPSVCIQRFSIVFTLGCGGQKQLKNVIVQTENVFKTEKQKLLKCIPNESFFGGRLIILWRAIEKLDVLNRPYSG